MKKIFSQTINHYLLKRTKKGERFTYPLFFVGLNIIFYAVLFSRFGNSLNIFLILFLITSILLFLLGIIYRTNNTILTKKQYFNIMKSEDYKKYNYDHSNEETDTWFITEDKYNDFKKWFYYKKIICFICILIYIVIQTILILFFYLKGTP